MSAQQTVSSRQMAYLLFVFLTGSAIVNIPGPLVRLAKNGAWISLLLSGTVGALTLACLLYLHRQHPAHSFVQLTRKTIGPWLALPLIAPFILLMFNMVPGIVLDIGLFLNSSMMKRTPMFVFHCWIFLVVALTVRAGIEVMARMFAMLTMLLLFFIGMVLILSIHNYKPALMLPILPDGWFPILQGAYYTIGFPYAELFVFGMLLPHVGRDRRSRDGLAKYMFIALLANVIVMVMSVLAAIMVFGPTVGDIKFSLFTVARMIDIEEIVQRIESFIGIALIVGSYMKASIALYALSAAIVQLFRLPDDRILIFPLALVNLFQSSVLYDGELRWGEVITFVWPLWNVTANLAPLLLLVLLSAAGIRAKRRRPAERSAERP